MPMQHIKDRIVRVTQGGRARLNANWHDSGVLLSDSKMFYITEGEIAIRIAGEETVCHAGDIVLIPAGIKHDYYLREGKFADKYWFHFSVESENGSFFDKYETPIRYAPKDADKAHIQRLFLSVVGKNEQGDELNDLRRLSAVLELSYYYIEKTGARQRIMKSDEISRVINYINDNLSRELSLSELAAVACLSANYFVRKFSTKVGVSPLKYVAMARMERAKSLLAHSDAPISDVMAEIGFEDASHFSKAFKMLTGYSPRGYRKMISSLSDI